MIFTSTAVVALLAAVPVALGQTFTDCDPTKKTCAADPGLETATFNSDFSLGKSALAGYTPAAGTYLTYGPKGAEFTIAKEGNAPTIESDFTFLFGTLEVVMQAAPGQGIISSIVLESADLDEVDWEFVGGDLGHVQSNYYGKGNTTSYDRVVFHPMSSPQTAFHTYKLDWTSERIIYSIDNAPVRTLTYAAANGGSNFPQTPMRVKLGNWSGGNPASPKGTVEWAGGYTSYSQAPFTMYVKSIKVTNNNPAKQYVWTDMSGSYKSIKVVAGDGKNSFPGGGSGSGSSASSTTASHTTHAPTTKPTTKSTTSSQSAAITTVRPVIRPNTNSTETTVRTSTTSSVSGTASMSSTRTTTSAVPMQTTNAGSSLSPAFGGLALLFTLGMSAWML